MGDLFRTEVLRAVLGNLSEGDTVTIAAEDRLAVTKFVDELREHNPHLRFTVGERDHWRLDAFTVVRIADNAEVSWDFRIGGDAGSNDSERWIRQAKILTYRIIREG